MAKYPWDFHADLSRDRLQLVAKVLTDVRKHAVLLHTPAHGDSPWSLGCRIYARSCEMLSRAADLLWPWVRVIQQPLEFVFRIGEVPVRFFSGDAATPDAEHLQATPAEAMQLGLIFNDARADIKWRIVVEPDAAGLAKRVVIIGAYAPDNVACRYVIPPLDDSVTLWDELLREPKVDKGVELPPAPVTSKKKDKGKQGDDE